MRTYGKGSHEAVWRGPKLVDGRAEIQAYLLNNVIQETARRALSAAGYEFSEWSVGKATRIVEPGDGCNWDVAIKAPAHIRPVIQVAIDEVRQRYFVKY